MFNKEMIDKIDSFLHENLDIVFDFKFNGLLLLSGDSLKGFIMGESIDDYNLYLHTFDKSNIKDFFKKNKIKYKVISEDEYQFVYNKLTFSIKSVNDLVYAGELNTDLLFYDIYRRQFIPFGIKYALKYRKIIIFNYRELKKQKSKGYLRKKLDVAKKFIHYMNKNNKMIFVIKK